jgi:hypothetical protein
MSKATTPIRIVDVDHGAQAAGCGACLNGASLPACGGALGAADVAPTLSGPADEIATLVLALTQRLGTTGDAQPTRWLRALKLAPGEVEVTLAVAAHCSGTALADSAFQALRGLLPDTDIYVRLAAS